MSRCSKCGKTWQMSGVQCGCVSEPTTHVQRVVKRRSWRKDASVKHRIYGEGVITNFVACQIGSANVYFYKGDCVREIARYELKPLNK